MSITNLREHISPMVYTIHTQRLFRVKIVVIFTHFIHFRFSENFVVWITGAWWMSWPKGSSCHHSSVEAKDHVTDEQRKDCSCSQLNTELFRASVSWLLWTWLQQCCWECHQPLSMGESRWHIEVFATRQL